MKKVHQKIAKDAKGRKPPGVNEIVRVMWEWRDTLRSSFTDRIGPTKGKISNRKVVREIECIEAGIKIILGRAA